MPRSSAAKGTAVQFGIFEVDPCAGELRKRGVKVKLQEQPFLVLKILLEHPGQVVTRDELRQILWPADTFVDFEHGLNNAVKRLREALGDVADTPRFVETVPKRGYRFIAIVTVSEQVGTSPSSPQEDLSPKASVPATSQSRVPAPRHWLKPLAGATVVLVVVGLLIGLNADGIGTRVRAAWSKPPQIHSLAVLPLRNLSDDPAQEYLSYGITEELITDLAQISELKVISHTSVLQYTKSNKPLPQIARELHVDGIVAGTMQRSGNRVRITAQLIYAPEEQHLWAASYDRDLQDVLALQANVAAAIVEPIRARTASRVSVPGRPHHSPPLEAVEDYLQGNYALERMAAGDGYAGYQAAIQRFKQAIAVDPEFAEAYEKLAVAYDAQFEWRPRDIMPVEKAALAKALELDPDLAEAHSMSAALKQGYDCDFPGAEKELLEVIRLLNPNSVSGHNALSSYLELVGRRDESIREAQRAQELDPEGTHEVGFLMSQGQYDLAIQQLRNHLELYPNDGFTYLDDGLINAYHFAGRYRDSIDAMQKAWTLFGFKEIGDGVGRVYATSGYAGALRYSARQLERLYAEGKVYKPDYIASWYARTGDKEQSLKWLNILLADNNSCQPGLSQDPDFALLRSDPRFQELAQRASRPGRTESVQ